MKDQADTQTAERFPAPRRRGRPSTGQAKSAAERMRAYRARKRAGEMRPQLKPVMTANVTKNAADPNGQEQTVAQLRKQLARVEHERDGALAKAKKEKRDVMNKASPMTDPVENLILEHLKALREELRDFKTQTVADLSLIKLRLTSLES